MTDCAPTLHRSASHYSIGKASCLNLLWNIIYTLSMCPSLFRESSHRTDSENANNAENIIIICAKTTNILSNLQQTNDTG